MQWPQLRVFSPQRASERQARQLLAERLSEPATQQPFNLLACPETDLACALSALSRQRFLACHPVSLLLLQPSSAAAATRANYDAGLSSFLDHCDRLTHWCTAEVLTAAGARARALLARRLWLTAAICADRGDLASAISLAEGLAGPRLQWAPGLHRLDARAGRARKRLARLRARLLSEPVLAVEDELAVPPHPRLLRAHLQALEAGSFRLASGGVKWDKVMELSDRCVLYGVGAERDGGCRGLGVV